jgi:hypothetical protein
VALLPYEHRLAAGVRGSGPSGPHGWIGTLARPHGVDEAQGVKNLVSSLLTPYRLTVGEPVRSAMLSRVDRTHHDPTCAEPLMSELPNSLLDSGS